MNAEHFRNLREFCPNARIDVGILLMWGCLISDSVLKLGEATSVLHINRDQDVADNWISLGKKSSKLERIFCLAEDMPPPGFRTLFEAPKPKLGNLHVNASTARTLDVDNMFEVLAERVSALDYLRYKGPRPTLHFLRSFVAADSSLKTVNFACFFVTEPLVLAIRRKESKNDRYGMLSRQCS